MWSELQFMWGMWKRRNVKISVLEQRIRELESDKKVLRDKLMDLRQEWIRCHCHPK